MTDPAAPPVVGRAAELAATVREALERLYRLEERPGLIPTESVAAQVALSELAALAADYQREFDNVMTKALDELERRTAAEAELAHLKSEFNYESWRGDHLVYAREWDAFNAWQRGDLSFEKRALAAETENTTLRQEAQRLRAALEQIEATTYALNEAIEAIIAMKGIARAALATTTTNKETK